MSSTLDLLFAVTVFFSGGVPAMDGPPEVQLSADPDASCRRWVARFRLAGALARGVAKEDGTLQALARGLHEKSRTDQLPVLGLSADSVGPIFSTLEDLRRLTEERDAIDLPSWVGLLEWCQAIPCAGLDLKRLECRKKLVEYSCRVLGAKENVSLTDASTLRKLLEWCSEVRSEDLPAEVEAAVLVLGRGIWVAECLGEESCLAKKLLEQLSEFPIPDEVRKAAAQRLAAVMAENSPTPELLLDAYERMKWLCGQTPGEPLPPPEGFGNLTLGVAWGGAGEHSREWSDVDQHSFALHVGAQSGPTLELPSLVSVGLKEYRVPAEFLVGGSVLLDGNPDLRVPIIFHGISAGTTTVELPGTLPAECVVLVNTLSPEVGFLRQKALTYGALIAEIEGSGSGQEVESLLSALRGKSGDETAELDEKQMRRLVQINVDAKEKLLPPAWIYDIGEDGRKFCRISDLERTVVVGNPPGDLFVVRPWIEVPAR